MGVGSIFAAIALSIASLLVPVMFFNAEDPNRWFQYLSMVGTLASVAGLVLVLVQLFSLKALSSAAADSAAEAARSIHTIGARYELGRAIRLLREVQSSIRLRKYELALIRMQEIKDILTAMVPLTELTECHITAPALRGHSMSISVEISNLEKSIDDFASDLLDRVRFNQVLESIADDLTNADARMRASAQ